VLQVHDYQGKLLCAPKHDSIKRDALSMPLVSVSNDFVAIVEPTKRTSVYFFSTAGGQATAQPLLIRKEDDTRKLVSDGNVAIMDIINVALSQSGAQVQIFHACHHEPAITCSLARVLGQPSCTDHGTPFFSDVGLVGT
jgi:hypothetical protein